MALTAASVYRESTGSLTLYIVNFSTVGSAGDTWAYGVSGNVLGYWAQATSVSVGTVANAGVAVKYSGSTFTIKPNLDLSEVNLFVWAKS